MSAAATGCGPAPVGRLADLPPVEAGAVAAMRLWFSGPATQARLWNALALRFGAEAGRARLRMLERCLALLVRGARRPVMRHGVGCACLGADECVLARLFGVAAAGRHGEAVRIARLIVSDDTAPALARLAERAAPGLACLAEGAAETGPPRPTVH